MDEPPEHVRYDSNIEARPRGDLTGSRWLPEVDSSEIDTSLGLCEAFQVRTKVLRVLVDQPHQLFHKLAQ